MCQPCQWPARVASLASPAPPDCRLDRDLAADYNAHMQLNWLKHAPSTRAGENAGADGLHIDERFRSLAEWKAWVAEHPFVYDAGYAADLAGRVTRKGIEDPLTGSFSRVDAGSDNWREGLLANGLNSRQRAVLALIAETAPSPQARLQTTIYGTEGITAFANELRQAFPRYLGSEFAINDDVRRAILPCLHQDLMNLNLPSDAFDIVTTNEVLEHVPDVDRALSEIARVLKPGGHHIGTHPFHFLSDTGDVRARLENGAVVHLKTPEYHGNPADPDGGSLVFETPGWDIVDRCRKAGFSDACMRFVASERYGYLTENTGVFILYARK